ncbi:hypothetical protein MKW94_027131 [Papaver nudicaule]|uniref:Sugar phosphate transporter domain-containing protein n=1 Tax=Papaver nudicaule TaxID=74823 RepID=A0AA41W331_PAPNU|nr:hypothetical protein [Papaver nudicaule]
MEYLLSLILETLRRKPKEKSLNGEGVDLEVGTDDKEKDKQTRSIKLVKDQNQALLSGLAYCVSSCSMILINKYVLSSYDFNAGISLMLYQNLVSVVIVSTLSFFGLISTEPLTWKLVRVWLPVNFIFVGMLITSLFRYIVSAVSGGVTDISFHVVGYTWQILNCFLTASYSLTLRRVMDTAKQVTKSGNLNEFTMVLLNNTLSLPLELLLIFLFNEVDYLFDTPLLRMPTFWLVMTSKQGRQLTVLNALNCCIMSIALSLIKFSLAVNVVQGAAGVIGVIIRNM